MNDLLFCTLIMALLIYFLVYLPRQKKLGTVKTTALASTQTDLNDKQITNLIQQWEQVASWAKEEGIDVNKSWNLNLLKKKIQQKLSQPNPQLENTLDTLIKNIQDLNKSLD